MVFVRPERLVVVVVVCNGEGEESGDEVDELSCGIWISCLTPPALPPFVSYMPGDETWEKFVHECGVRTRQRAWTNLT